MRQQQAGYYRAPGVEGKEDIMVQLGHLLMKHYHKARLVVRLGLGGCTNRPFYRIVVAHNKRARDGKYFEQVGCYDPLPNNQDERIVGVNFERLKYWIANGALLTKPVEKLLGLSGFFPLHPMTITNAERSMKQKALQAEAAAAAPTPEETTAVKE
ncbi:28S ribosomal protein S16, mitochondrial isoform X2 [Hemicordylus capensis]|uniref:28S ribosomal protein S16, mitochondrial isoform X2 n=1 Tax=Hemicordylus capensis TaxID=884348 RepID=UPI00230332D3|nr:28S ribosomal protein S16, mitochondrial isoform X2 [Hemicordylus capensis]